MWHQSSKITFFQIWGVFKEKTGIFSRIFPIYFLNFRVLEKFRQKKNPARNNLPGNILIAKLWKYKPWSRFNSKSQMNKQKGKIVNLSGKF